MRKTYIVIGNCALTLDENGLLSIMNMVELVATDGQTIKDVLVPDFENMLHVSDVEDWDQTPWENGGMSSIDIEHHSAMLAELEEISR